MRGTHARLLMHIEGCNIKHKENTIIQAPGGVPPWCPVPFAYVGQPLDWGPIA